MDTESQIVLNESDSCSICLQTIDETLKCITNCNHIFCRRCLHEWFDVNKISCPVCRRDIKDYNNNETKNHIVKIISEGNNNNQVYNQVILELNKKIGYLRLILCFNFIYLLYSLWDINYLSSCEEQYEYLYHNCSSQLDQCNGQLEDTEDYIETLTNIEEQYGTLRPLDVIIHSKIFHCLFPSYYINKCSIFI